MRPIIDPLRKTLGDTLENGFVRPASIAQRNADAALARWLKSKSYDDFRTWVQATKLAEKLAISEARMRKALKEIDAYGQRPKNPVTPSTAA